MTQSIIFVSSLCALCLCGEGPHFISHESAGLLAAKPYIATNPSAEPANRRRGVASTHYGGETIAKDTTILEAIQQTLDAAKGRKERKFIESVELAMNIKDVDLANPANRINEEIVLPKGRGRALKVGVFAGGETALLAKDVADTVITPEMIDDLADDKRQARKLANQHAFFVAETKLMATIGRVLGIVLGPRGKMPKPLPPNADVTRVVEGLRSTIKVRSKDRPTFHATLGTTDMSVEDLAANAETVLKRVTGKLERGYQNVASIYIKTSMGPSVRWR